MVDRCRVVHVRPTWHIGKQRIKDCQLKPFVLELLFKVVKVLASKVNWSLYHVKILWLPAKLKVNLF